MRLRLRAIDQLFAPKRRLLFAALLGGVTFFLMPGEWRLSMRALIGWNIGALLYIIAASRQPFRRAAAQLHDFDVAGDHRELCGYFL